MFDVKVVTSLREVDCAPTCLKMLLDYYGVDVDLDTLIAESNLNINGMSAKETVRVGKLHGLDLKAYEMSVDELAHSDRPAIIWWRNNHFCIFCGVDKDGRMQIINPDRGKYRLNKDTFDVFYSGVALFNGEPHEMIEPSAEERLEAQVLYTAMMTDTLLEV